MNFSLYFLSIFCVIISPPMLAQAQQFDVTLERIIHYK